MKPSNNLENKTPYDSYWRVQPLCKRVLAHSSFSFSSFSSLWIFPSIRPADILALCEKNLDDKIDSGNFSVGGYLPLIWKDSSTYMHGLAVYVKEGLPFAQDLSLQNSADSYLCCRLALLHSVPYFFFLYRSPSSRFCTVFDSISLNIDEVLSINLSANVLVFGDYRPS